MAHPLGLGAPVGGLALGVFALALWVSGTALARLDLLVALLLLVGLGLAAAGYLRGASATVRRVSIVALGWNAFGLAAVALLYAGG
jgi:hypothetical protein